MEFVTSSNYVGCSISKWLWAEPWCQATWVQIPGPPLSKCPVFQFAHPSGENTSAYLVELLRGLKI